MPAKVVSERLGHAKAFTLQVYGHVIPGMDEQAASTVADLILGESPTAVETAFTNPLTRRGRTPPLKAN